MEHAHSCRGSQLHRLSRHMRSHCRYCESLLYVACDVSCLHRQVHRWQVSSTEQWGVPATDSPSCHIPQAGIYDDFARAVTEQVNKFKVGDGLVDGTTLGPLISPAAVERVRFSIFWADADSHKVRVS